MADWRSEILDNVATVEFPGANPGYIIVYGKESDAILSNKNLESLIAASEKGRGRVVVFSHDMFPKSYKSQELPELNKTLLENVRSWVTRGREDPVAMNADDVDDFASIPENTFLYWSNVKNDYVFVTQLLSWVENGGGLVCGVDPWFSAYHTGLSYEEFSISFFMTQLGMCYGRIQGMFSTWSRVQSVSENTAESARIDRAFQLLRTAAETKRLKRSLLPNMSCLPMTVYLEVAATVKAIAADFSISAPAKANPVSSKVGKMLTIALHMMMLKDGQDGKAVVAEGREEFPGEFDQPPVLKTATVYVSGKEGRVIPTGCYLPAGVELVLSWSVESGEAKEWSVIVGAHTDDLTVDHVKDPWRRWPTISITEDLKTPTLKLRSPYGGLVYIRSPKSEGKLRVTLSNIVPAPRFTYETENDWENIESKKPGLWCDISGELITITLPSKAIRHVKDPGSVMRMWDNVVRAHTELRGRDPSDGRGQWVVADEQPEAGYMHAGYPIVTTLDEVDPNWGDGQYFLLNIDGLINPKTPNGGLWGMFHELGHNYQYYQWTWDGNREVTCNIFSLHAIDTIYNNKNPWIHEWLANKIPSAKVYFTDGVDFKTWKNKAGLALFIYAQLARDFGWETYTKVFREYDALPHNTSIDEEEIITQWIVRFSHAAGRNLCPVFEFWGFPYTDRLRESLSDLPPYLPSDVMTKEFGLSRAQDIARKYRIEI